MRARRFVPAASVALGAALVFLTVLAPPGPAQSLLEQAGEDLPARSVALVSALPWALLGFGLGFGLGGRRDAGAAREARRLVEQLAERDLALEMLRQRITELRYDLESARRRVVVPPEDPPEVPVPAGWPGAAGDYPS